MPATKEGRAIGAAEYRRLSVIAHCDPRTVRRVHLGEPVRGDSGARALEALIKAGYLSNPAKKGQP